VAEKTKASALGNCRTDLHDLGSRPKSSAVGLTRSALFQKEMTRVPDLDAHHNIITQQPVAFIGDENVQQRSRPLFLRR
jgi:hypothetical protein